MPGDTMTLEQAQKLARDLRITRVYKLEDVLRLCDFILYGGWRPIETAPRGNHFLLVWDGGAISKDTGVKVWRSSGSDLGQFTRAGITHWQPLPAPPSAEPSKHEDKP